MLYDMGSNPGKDNVVFLPQKGHIGSYSMDTWVPLWAQSGRGVEIAAHLHRIPRLRTSAAKLYPLPICLHGVARDNFTVFSQQTLLYITSLIIPCNRKRRHMCFSRTGKMDCVPADNLYRDADKSLARPTSRCVFFDGWNISFDASLVIYI